MSDQKIARLDAALPDFPEAFDRLLITPSEADSDLAGVVAGIIAEVATEGTQRWCASPIGSMIGMSPEWNRFNCVMKTLSTRGPP